MKDYLGDAVYVDGLRDEVVLTTEYDGKITNQIVLQPHMLAALVKHIIMRGLDENIPQLKR